MRGLLKNVGLRSNDGVSRGLVPDEDVTDTSPDMVCLFSLEEVVTEEELRFNKRPETLNTPSENLGDGFFDDDFAVFKETFGRQLRIYKTDW